jgi:ABC-type glycerol-3-phosphate transport system substrate-binding protein
MQLPNKRTGVVTALVCAALAITACGGGSDDSSDKAASGPATGTITIWRATPRSSSWGAWPMPTTRAIRPRRR